MKILFDAITLFIILNFQLNQQIYEILPKLQCQIKANFVIEHFIKKTSLNFLENKKRRNEISFECQVKVVEVLIRTPTSLFS